MSFRAGYVGLIGQPNAGKSTLLNVLVGEKVAIVTPKPQTTRQRVVGIANTEAAQLCFVDAPGFIQANKGLNHFLEKEYQDVMAQSDVLVAVLSLDEKKPETLQEVVRLVASAKKPWVAFLNKMDLSLNHRLPVIHEMVRAHGVPLVYGSAEKQAQSVRDELLPMLIERLPESPGPLFDPEMYTTHNLRELTCETIREKCFLNLHQEIPFGLAVRIRDFDENSGRTVKIQAELIVGKDNHRPMVIGRGGQKLKSIGTQARQDLEKLVGRPVFLNLHVVTRDRWSENPRLMKELGYVVASS